MGVAASGAVALAADVRGRLAEPMSVVSVNPAMPVIVTEAKEERAPAFSTPRTLAQVIVEEQVAEELSADAAWLPAPLW